MDFNHIKIKNTTFNFYQALPAAMSVVAMALASLPPYCIGKFILRNQLGIGNLDATGADHCVLNFGEIYCFSLLNLGATKLMDGKVILPRVRH